MNEKGTSKDRFAIEGTEYWSDWLRQWRIWLLGAVLGLGLALALYAIAPPAFRAQATVVVDQNAEQAWTYFPDRQLFQFIRRETARLVELAWSDDVLTEVAAEAEGLSLAELRASVLDLSQPADPELTVLLEEITTLAERVDGVSPYVEASLAQQAQLPSEREVSQASYALAGALAGMLLAFFLTLLRSSALRKNQ